MRLDTVYVYCCNAQLNTIVIILYACTSLYSINCPFVICSPNMLSIFILLVNYGSWSCISFIAKQQSTNTLFIYCSLLYCKLYFPHHIFNPLWSAKLVGLTTSLFSWGKVSFVLCVGFTLPTSHSLTNSFLAPLLRSDKSNTFRSDSLLLLVR